MSHSLVALQKRPWIFFLELIYWLIWGTGMLLAPVLQLAIFASSSLLDKQGYPIQEKMADSQDIPDIEIMPVSFPRSEY